MTKFPIPEAALTQHIAAIGKTGAGKTIAVKDIVEHVVKLGHRVCILDTAKSDHWGLTSSADGKRPGLPFHILGGPRGHVPLHESAGKAIGELVASGALPLSIIDMADFKPGGQMQFFADFAPALFKKMRGVVYLVIEEAHEIAPKERIGFNHENFSVHWAKKIATASRTKGIRMVVATQRVQALHNAVLGSCDTLIAMRLTAPADQEPVQKWLKANVDKKRKETVAEIEDELGRLKTGTAWVCSGEADFFEKVTFPMITTFDNSATPDGKSAEIHVKTAPVDQDKLRSIIGDAVKEAEANDPKTLKAELERTRQALAVAEQSKSVPVAVVAPAGDKPAVAERIKAAKDEAFKRGFLKGHKVGIGSGEAALRYAADGTKAWFEKLADAIKTGKDELFESLGEARSLMQAQDFAQTGELEAEVAKLDQAQAETVRAVPAAPALPQRPAAAPMPVRISPVMGPGGEAVPGNQQRVLNSLATWASMGQPQPSNAQVAWLAGYSPNSTSYTNPRGAARQAALLEYPSPDRVALTDAGRAVASAITLPSSLLEFVLSQLPGNEQRVLRAVAEHYPNSASNETVAPKANYTADSTSYTNPRGALKSKELISYPSGGQVRAADWLFQRAA